MSKKIPLTQGKFAIVDDKDFDYLNQWKWRISEWKGSKYAVREVRINKKQHTIRMHRLIMKAILGQEIDHRNHNGLDNRKGNLRFCSHKQNLQNSKKRQNCSSKFKGVCWDKIQQQWAVRLGPRLGRIWVGRFDSEIEAAKAYDYKAKEVYGEFAYANF